ncbi:2,5-diamino-6-(ribosylamino)-4(3H)-pyrimidinone 5'-phosphate reductase [Methanobacterium alcaliphilum]|uniref:2,5-diamino-6-(ribosylamino)-4(3H)-pyrimidinone 5'-phosphate reductase n=1 Tax=Methanobacterium alcaliphilum TaxID=392018 RepID=UPI00200B16E6|nr:2,5-diamino-6-(ribosylamino)-4(3H)-pyrimidinone 5'-phosphate reductase [Methanobacterium alcaliphilum]MCK9152499.1 2,5-diamino-6-(ribosylamino)-4(3H)-pyrimidinone 5'-phosphate reductase [Methanobacterium alcaliphilum]
MRPHVILNAAMTLDGKIATRTGSSEISGNEDLKRVHQIRKDSDAIMVGINTLLVDDPRLTVHKIDSKRDENPVRVVVDSRARTPPDARILNKDASTLIAVSKKAPLKKIQKLKEKAEVMIMGNERVDLLELMRKLKNKGINTLMLEGGSTLNFSMIENGLVDEVRICIAPMIVGGVNAKTLVDGEGFDFMKDAAKLKLKNSYDLGKDFILEYDVL